MRVLKLFCECGIVEEFEAKTRIEARVLAKLAGWKNGKCPKCVKAIREPTSDQQAR